MFREKLGDIEQRDAVTNVQTGIKNSAVITKQYFNTLDGLVKHLLTDMLNLCKISIKDSFKGSLILGNRLTKIFTVIPEHVSFTDYDIHIGDSTDIVRDIELIKQMIMELMKGGLVSPELLFETVTTESLTEFRETGLASIRKTKEETGQMQGLQQQVAQYQDQLKQLQQQLKDASSKLEKSDANTLQLKQKEIDSKTQLGVAEFKQKKEFDDKTLELKERQIDAEVLQLADGNNKNDEIKNIG